MNYLLPLLLAVACCNLAIALVYLWRTRYPVIDDTSAYNRGIQAAGEILIDVRIECGIARGENPMLEEVFKRLKEARK